MRAARYGLVVALTASACRTPCRADVEPTPAQLQREQKAVYRGQAICLELLTPSLRLVDDDLVLVAAKETLVAKRSELPATVVTRFAPLAARLAGYRDHFKAVRPADPFAPTLNVELDPTLEPSRAATLLATAALAGYPRAHVVTNDVGLEVDYWIGRRDPAVPSALCVTPAGGGFDVRREGSHDVADLATLADAVSRVCADAAPCADVVGIGEGDGATFEALARLTAAVLAAPPFAKRSPRVTFVTRAPVELGDVAPVCR